MSIPLWIRTALLFGNVLVWGWAGACLIWAFAPLSVGDTSPTTDGRNHTLREEIERALVVYDAEGLPQEQGVWLELEKALREDRRRQVLAKIDEILAADRASSSVYSSARIRSAAMRYTMLVFVGLVGILAVSAAWRQLTRQHRGLIKSLGGRVLRWRPGPLLKVAVIALLVVLLWRAIPRYDYRHTGGNRWVQIDRWTGAMYGGVVGADGFHRQ